MSALLPLLSLAAALQFARVEFRHEEVNLSGLPPRQRGSLTRTPQAGIA